MSKKGNKYKIGALALSAIIILVLGLLSLGIMKYFQPDILFTTSTENSVQGLKVGSNVKVKGVTIGSVKSIKIGMDGSKIYILMKFDLSSFMDQSQMEIPIDTGNYQRGFNKKVMPLIDKGLRCQLQYEGITGDMYVDLAYFDPNLYPAQRVEVSEDQPPYIPLVPVASIGNILEDTQTIIKRLNSIDYEHIANNFDSLVASAKEFTLQLKEITDEKKIIEMRDNINYSLDKFNQTMISLNVLIKTIQMQPDSVVWGKAGQKVVPSLNEIQMKN